MLLGHLVVMLVPALATDRLPLLSSEIKWRTHVHLEE